MLTVTASAVTVTQSGVDTVYIYDYDVSSVTPGLSSTSGTSLNPLTFTGFGDTYRFNGGVNYSSLILADNFNSQIAGDNMNHFNLYYQNYFSYIGDRATSFSCDVFTENYVIRTSNSLDVSVVLTSVDYYYAPSIKLYNDGSEVGSLDVSYIETIPANGFDKYIYHYGITISPEDSIVFDSVFVVLRQSLNYNNLPTTEYYNRYRFSLSDVQVVELADQTVRDYYSAISAGNNDLIQYFGTVNEVDAGRISSQKQLNDSFSNTVDSYISTNSQLPDFNFGEEFYSVPSDLEEPKAASDLYWSVFFGSAAGEGFSDFDFFFKRILAVITIISVISLLITGIPNLIRKE